jgi:Mitochondrial carrier protein
VKKYSTVPDTGMTYAQFAGAGFFSAIPMTAITAPFERIKIVLQIQGQQGGQQKYSGGFDALKGIYREGGIRSGITRHNKTLKFSLSRFGRHASARWSRLRGVFCRVRVCKESAHPQGRDPFASCDNHCGRVSRRRDVGPCLPYRHSEVGTTSLVDAN